jgi:glutamate 5-kinase
MRAIGDRLKSVPAIQKHYNQIMKLKDARRIVVKVGSSTVTDADGRLDRDNIKSLVDQIAEQCAQAKECILVTSGAIAAGVERLKLNGRPRDISGLQAAAAVGQGLLIQEYAGLFGRFGLEVAQILLTQHDMAHRELYLNARRTINRILAMKAVPIVNENDTTAVEEIKFGDNDMLAALVAVLIEADLLIILSDVDGLYACDPRKEGACRISRIDEITPEVEAMAETIGSKFGSGGMSAKLKAARIAGAAKIAMYIADGREADILGKIMSGGEVGTYFVPARRKIAGRKLWIGYGRAPQGRVVVDSGAAKAIVEDGRSLLPAGVTDISGQFSIGDTIEVLGADGRVIARGLSNYEAAELRNVKGKRTNQIAERMNADFSEEVIHRDFMVLL